MWPYYTAVDKQVLKSDLLRILIMDKYGGCTFAKGFGAGREWRWGGEVRYILIMDK